MGELAEGEPPVADGGGGPVPKIGEEDPADLPGESLFDPAATARIVLLWVLSPTLSVVGSYLLFLVVL